MTKATFRWPRGGAVVAVWLLGGGGSVVADESGRLWLLSFEDLGEGAAGGENQRSELSGFVGLLGPLVVSVCEVPCDGSAWRRVVVCSLPGCFGTCGVRG